MPAEGQALGSDTDASFCRKPQALSPLGYVDMQEGTQGTVPSSGRGHSHPAALGPPTMCGPAGVRAGVSDTPRPTSPRPGQQAAPRTVRAARAAFTVFLGSPLEILVHT